MTQTTAGTAHWLSAARAGSREALGQMLQDCRDYLLHIAIKELNPALQGKAGASDLVQQTLTEATRDFPAFQGQSEQELFRWLRRMLLNNIYNFTRDQLDTGKRGGADEVSLSDGPSSSAPPPALIAPDPTPSWQMMTEEQAQALWQAVDRLPDDYREVILLHHQEELPFGEVARLMDRSENAAEHLWLRAIERLRDELVKPR